MALKTIQKFTFRAAEQGLLPESLIRFGIRRLCQQRLAEAEQTAASQAAFRETLAASPLALLPEMANEQHYEVPAAFFALMLGPARKYSCCYWDSAVQSLAEAEDAALRITCERAELADGQEILELGCGWGSLSLWMAEHYPAARITAVSNSHSQREFIEAQADQRGLNNLQIITADINEFTPPQFLAGMKFHRVVSVEMFEHLRNYPRMLKQIADWLTPEGQLFVHIFCHQRWAYPFETDGPDNWMGRYFFSGGIMPSFDLLQHFDRDLRVARQWTWNGRHYQRTAEAWLQNMKDHKREILPILAAVYGPRMAKTWYHRWQIFLLAVAELFGYARGDEWFVAHYLLRRS